LFASFLLSFLFFFPFFLLDKISNTLLSASNVWILCYYYLILRVTSSSSKSLKSF
jgi:ferritin-like protein